MNTYQNCRPRLGASGFLKLLYVAAIALAAMWQAGHRVHDGKSHHESPLVRQGERLECAGRTDLRAEVAILVAAGVGKHCHWRPERLEAVLQSGGLQDRPGAHFEALFATDAQIEESLFRHAARRTDGTGGRTGSKACQHCPRRTGGDGTQHRTAGQRCLCGHVRLGASGVGGEWDEVDGLGGAHTAASLAEGAIERACAEVQLDGVKGADLKALSAVDAAVIDLPLKPTEKAG